MAQNRDKLVMHAKLAEQALRFEDMAKSMKEVVKLGAELSKEECKLLSISFNNIIFARRFAWRNITARHIDESEVMQEVINEYREKVEKEIKDICEEVLNLLDKYLIPKAINPELEVFYENLKGDYYRYLAEIATGDERNEVIEKSQGSYQEAFESAKDLSPAHPFRLNLILYFSFFYFDILNSPDKARQLANEALDEATEAELEMLDEDSRRDSTAIIQLIRENMVDWVDDEMAADEQEEHIEERDENEN